MPQPTSTQLEALEWLEASHAASPEWASGFNPESKAHARACRHSLEPMGLVAINRLSAQHFRYLLTDAGRKALADHRETQKVGAERRAARKS